MDKELFMSSTFLLDQWPRCSAVCPDSGRFGVEFDLLLTPLCLIPTAVVHKAVC